MTIRKTVRTLALASILALIIMGVPAFRPQVHAEPSCSSGFCRDCLFQGVWYEYGTRIHILDTTWVCDGDDGKWYLVEAVGPPHPITIAPIGIVAR